MLFLVKYSLKETLRNKPAMFWNLLFPFILATIYGAVLLNLDESRAMSEPIPIMVEDKAYDGIFRMIKMENEKPIFEVKPYENPMENLKEGKIAGFIKGMGDEAEVVLKKRDIKSTILFNMTNSIHHTFQAVKEIMKEPDNQTKMESLMEDLRTGVDIAIKDGMAGKDKKRTVLYFYSLMAMICLGAMPFGVVIVENTSLVSDMKAARRRMVSPVGKTRLVMADFVSSLLITSCSTLILFAYIRYGIGVEFGGDNVLLIAGLLLGNMMATVLGMFLAFVMRGKTDTKISISAALYVLSAALSGMMVNSLSGFISDKAPIVNHMNPGTILTKMFTSLYLYEGSEMYFKYLANSAIVTVFGFAIVLFLMRRSYDSI